MDGSTFFHGTNSPSREKKLCPTRIRDIIMKRVLFIISIALLFILPSRHVYSQEMVDLGLPSGTKWKQCGEKSYTTTYSAILEYGNQLPTESQIRELRKYCEWSWQDGRFKVIGPNGNYIFMEAKGYKEVYDTKVYRSTGDIFQSASDGRDRGVYVSKENIVRDGQQGVYVYANNGSRKPQLFMFYDNYFDLDYSFKEKSSSQGKYYYLVSVHLVETDWKKQEEMKKEEQRKKEEERRKKLEQERQMKIEQERQMKEMTLVQSKLFAESHEYLFTSNELTWIEEGTFYSTYPDYINDVNNRQEIYNLIKQNPDVFSDNYYYELMRKGLYNKSKIVNDSIEKYKIAKIYNNLIGKWKANEGGLFKRNVCKISSKNNQLYLTLKYYGETIFDGYLTGNNDNRVKCKISSEEIVIDINMTITKKVSNSQYSYDARGNRYWSGLGGSTTQTKRYHFYFKDGHFILDDYSDMSKSVVFKK